MNRRRIGAVLVIGIALISGVIVMCGHRWLTHQRPLPANLIAALLVPGGICLSAGIVGVFIADIADTMARNASRYDAAARRMDLASQRAGQLIKIGTMAGEAQASRRFEAMAGGGATVTEERPASGDDAPLASNVRRLPRPRPHHPSE